MNSTLSAKLALAGALAAAAVASAHGQGTFGNLDFEGANIQQTQPPGYVSAIDAVPG